ncbi:hypothetical protein MUJ63_09535 [Lachnospiraceae bacterium NSJ-143]|nr:hypothetical protein [Lachnospiraceae bacterium NSJ-143]
MKKKIFKLCTGLICALTLMATPVSTFAAEPEATTTIEIDLDNLSSVTETQDGIAPLINIGKGSLKNGYTMTYSDSDGSKFYIKGGTTVKFVVKTSESAHVAMGYKDSDGTKHQLYDGEGRSNSCSISIDNTGYYQFYVTNIGSNTISITGGSITF